MELRSLFVFMIMVAIVSAPNFLMPTLDVQVAPSAVDPGQCADIIATETNPSLPLFDYTLSAWLPCGRDWAEVNTWSALREKGGPFGVVFSGVLDRRTVSTITGPRFEYEQCYYTWALPKTGQRETRTPGSPIITPNDVATVTITLCANRGARAGTYELDIWDSFNFPGKTEAKVG